MRNDVLEQIVEKLTSSIATRIQTRIGGAADRNSPGRRLLTVEEAANYIGRTAQAVQHLIHKRELIVVRKGRRVHLDRADLDRWIEANKV